MAAFTFDHIHLRSPDPEATAAFYERVFDAALKRSPQRIDIDLGGQVIFVSPVNEDGTGEAPSAPYRGLEHIGLAVKDIDILSPGKAGLKGSIYVAEVTWSAGGKRGVVPADCPSLRKYFRVRESQ